MARWLVLLPLLLLVLAAGPAAAATLYSIDVNTDQLVTIDTATGAITTVGAIGHNFSGVSLAWLGGHLYATTLPPCATTFVDLVKIDPSTGAKVSQVRVKVGATDLQVSAADGLTAGATTLMISYRAASGACGQAHVLADLSTAGAVTNQTDFYPVAGVASDMDNLAYDPTTGTLIGQDGVTGGATNPMNFYSVARPSTYALAGSHSVASNDGYSGTVFTDTGVLYAYLRTAHQVRRIDPATGAVLQTIALSPARTLRGLAYAPQPTPALPETWGGVKAIYR